MFWEVLLGSRLGFRWWSPGSLVFYPVVLIGELLGPAPTSPERPYEKAWTAFNFATLRLCDFATSTSHCVSRWAIFSTMGFIRP